MYGDERKKRGDWLIRLLIVFVLAIPAGLGFLAYKLLKRPPAQPPVLEPLPTVTEAPTPVSTATPLPSGTPLPELEKSDAFIRDLVAMLSKNPSWATWLAT